MSRAVETRAGTRGGTSALHAVLLVALVSLASACGTDAPGPPLPTVTREEVTDMPVGDANIQPNFTGFYLSVSERLTGCSCRIGNCSIFSPQVGEQFTVNLFGGAVDIFTGGSLEFRGGVNRDGSFWCGGFSDELGGAGNIKLTGTFDPPVKPVRLDVTSNRTVMGVNHGANYDCDLSGSGHFQAPL